MSEFSDWLFSQNCEFLIGSSDLAAIPDFLLPEIAFVGRSNVGKSSLINKLTNRLTLARVSNTPGRTKQLNFFALGKKLMLVDLPGYGYAKAAKTDIAIWNKLIYKYLQARPTLRRVCLLIDSRHGLKESDFMVMKLLDEVAVNYQIILTKSDKTTLSEMAQIIEDIKKLAPNHPAMHPEVITTSSRYGGEGIKDLKEELATFVS